MTEHERVPLAQTKSNDKRPFSMNDPNVERVLSTTMAVASEVAVLRERLDTIERLLEMGEPVTPQSIEGFAPDESIIQERKKWHADYISRILRIVQQEMNSL
jgi:hypothetical protein